MRKEAPTGFQKGYVVPPKTEKSDGFEGSAVSEPHRTVHWFAVCGWSSVERDEGFQHGVEL